MEIFDELDKLEKYGLGNSDYEAFMEKLSDAAKSKINKDESLTAAAIKEAERAGITEVKYTALLDFILNPGEEKAETYIKDIINKYKIAKLSITKTTLRATIEAPEELVKEQKINSIVANYAKLKSKIPLSSLMLLNGKNTPGDAIEKQLLFIVYLKMLDQK